MLPTLLISLVQIAVIFATARFIFPLVGLDAFQFGESPLALALLVLAVALCSTGLGVLIAALARTQAQIGGIAALILWVAALIGGSLMPLFLFSPFLASLSRLTPHGWANIAFFNVLVRGRGLADIGPALLALLGFTALFVGIGLWRFKFE
jgi:ABC-2 type transport system permease protein